MRYFRPEPALAPYVSGYHIYAVNLEPGERVHDVFYPGWTNIRISFPEEPWSVRMGRRSFDPVPGQAVFGPTSRAAYVDTGSGTLFGAGITPAGWARFFARDVSRYADRIAPLDQLIGDSAVMLSARLREGEPPKQVFDDFFLQRMERGRPVPAEVAALRLAIADPQVGTVAELEERLGFGGRPLSRLSRRAFGFTPKLLLRRARFMRALMGAWTVGRGHWSDGLAGTGYYDQSHFLRDCRLFLDMPLGAFIALPKPMAELSLAAREEALGAPVQVLHKGPIPPRDASAKL